MSPLAHHTWTLHFVCPACGSFSCGRVARFHAQQPAGVVREAINPKPFTLTALPARMRGSFSCERVARLHAQQPAGVVGVAKNPKPFTLSALPDTCEAAQPASTWRASMRSSPLAWCA